MTDNLDLNMRLTTIGAQESAADVERIRAAIKKLRAPVDQATAAFRAMGEQIEATVATARAATTSAAASFQRMTSTITAESREMRTTLGGTFVPLSEGALASTRESTAAVAKMVATAKGDLDWLKTGLASTFAPLTEGIVAAADAVKAGAVTMSAALDGVMAQTKAAAAEMRALSMPAPGVAPGSRNANLRRAAGRGHRGPHFRAEGVKAPGGHISLGSGPVMGAAAVGGYAVWEAMQAQDEALRLALTSQVEPKMLGISTEEYQRIIMSGSAETGDSVEAVADAYSGAIRGMQGVEPGKRLDLIKKLLPTARAESKLKGAPLAETLQSFIELGHQTGTYEPDALKALSSKLAIASLSVNSSLPEFGKTLSYSLPTLHAGVGLDADTVIAMTAALQNAGVNSTKSGTWIRSFYEGLLPKAGAKPDDKHNSALRRLGLGSPAAWQVRDQAGNVDWSASTDRASTIMRERTSTMSESQRATYLKDAFGERGAGVASLMMQQTVKDQFDGIRKKISGGAEVDLFKQYSENSSLQQAQQTWRDTQNLLIDIGQTALPAVNTGLRDLDSLVKEIAAAMQGDWKGLGKDLWDHLIKPDLGPLGRLNTSPPSDADRQDPVDMTDPRRKEAPQPDAAGAAPSPGPVKKGWDPFRWLRKDTAFMDGGDTLGDGVERPTAGSADMVVGLRIWAAIWEEAKRIREDIERPGDLARRAITDRAGTFGEGTGAKLWNASYGGTDGSSGGSGAGSFDLPGFSGKAEPGKWWTADRREHAIGRLMAEAHLTRAGAEGLVARWSTVEAAGGPLSLNPKSGAAGIGQWLGSRKRGFTGDYDSQITHAIGELNGSEKRAGDVLRRAQTDEEGARGASMFERAEGYNGKTGIDHFTAKTIAGIRAMHQRVKETVQSAPGATRADPAEVAPNVRHQGGTHHHHYNIKATDPKGTAAEILASQEDMMRAAALDLQFS